MPRINRHRRRVPQPEPSHPRGEALVAALQAIAARHPLTAADKDHILANVGRWRREVLGEPESTPTEDAGAADAPPGEVIERTP
jgi:hypothetical protein